MDFKYGEQNEKKEDESPIKGRRGPRKKKIDLTIFKSPGVYVIEHDINIVRSSSNYKIYKIHKILNRIMSV